MKLVKYSFSIDGLTGIWFFLNENDCEMVPISLENYKNYFKLKDYFEAEKDQFGDYTYEFTYQVYLTLKDGLTVCTGMSSVKFKCTYTVSKYGFEFNKSNGQYKRSGIIYQDNNAFQAEGSCSTRKDGIYSGGIGSTGFLQIMPGMGLVDYEYTAKYPENINITRIMGYLCLLK